MFTKLILFVALTHALGGGIARADVLSVPAEFLTIQQAVDAAQPFDIVLVAPGNYSESVEVLAKGISLVGDGGDVGMHQLVVRLVPAGEVVSISGFRFDPPQPFNTFKPGLIVRSNVGAVRFSDCVALGDHGNSGSWQPFEAPIDGTVGAQVANNASVSFIDCVVFGGGGATLFDEDFEAGASSGGAAVSVSNSTLSIFDCELRGGNGGSVDDTVTSAGGRGGSGLLAQEGARVEVHGSLLRGGGGGSGDCNVFGCGSGGSAGDGARLRDAGTHARFRDVEFQPGSGGPNGDGTQVQPPGDDVDTDAFATALFHTAPHRSLGANTPVREGGILSLSVTGAPGDTARLYASLGAGQVSLIAFQGVFLLGFPFALSGVNLGTIPGGGALNVPLLIPDLGPGLEGVDVHLQLVVHDGAQSLLGPARVTTLLDGSR